MGFKLRTIFLVCGFAFCAFATKAQPIAVQQNLPAVNEVNVYAIRGYKSEELNATDNAPTKYNQILSIGRLLPSQITTDNSGQWNYTRTGRVWRLKIKADKAKGITLFGKVKYMPKGAVLNLYDADASQWVGTYTAHNFKTHNILSTETVTGEEAILEYFEPYGVDKTANFIIESIGYMYRQEKGGEGFQRKAFGQSGGCHVNINCPEGGDWEDQKKAVVQMRVVRDFIIGTCTGTLVRTTDKQYKPYLLTAMHCALNPSEDSIVNDTMFAYWQFKFNYESPTCANPFNDSGFNKQIIIGSEVLAHSDDLGGEFGSDFLLLKLSTFVPSEWKSYYAGWNLDTVRQYDSGVSIHHPNGDIKKVSTYKWPLSFDEPFQTSPDDTHWEVIWSKTANGHGTTEPGSSGAPLFDDNGLIVGTLTGGLSSCNNTSGTDLFGRIDWHWTRNGADSLRRLKYWLDPENTGAKSLQGSYDEVRSVRITQALPLQLVPNPVKNTLEFSSELLSGAKLQVQIVDILGKTHVATTLNTNKVNVEQLPAGVYFISIKEKNNYFSGKFIKQ